MIRNAVIHITNEQPLLVDLFETPKPVDQGLICTNVRMMDGKKPIFVDHSDSVFLFPYLHVRFLEIMPVVSDVPAIEAPGADVAPPPAEADADDAEMELDEDFLRRIREV